MDRRKVLEFFDGKKIREPIHIVGCGAIGSHVAESLARMGCEKIHLWDFDTVSPHNITNQMFYESDIGRPKVECVHEMMCAINKGNESTVVIHNEPLKAPWILNGYIFMCVDNIDVRREIVKANQYNPNAVAIMDFRMRLTDAQYYCACIKNRGEVKEMLASMDFTQEEGVAATPKSACGTELSVVYTVKTIVSAGVCNFVKLVHNEKHNTKIFVDMNFMVIDSF